ncbi:TetR/AcrR family transcriptional regulator [Bacillus massilinigeriensis]|uniref:TetR/AcrR family transcriptional regulator n=1 Tax=Bacillus massilionigeriensis TaxID=1805475 RepID=UPI00096B0544|nr:TetR/AcrR family transcriptional regulator [Bacillus massilionigeriensis]
MGIENKEDKIIESALILFAEKGFHGTNVPEIAKLANVGTGTIYRYFSNKEALVNKVYQVYMKKLSNSILSNFPTTNSTYEKYLHIMNNLIQFAKDNKTAFIFIETHNHANYLDESSTLIVQEFQSFLNVSIQEGVKQKHLRDYMPSEALIAIIYGAYVAFFKRIEAGEIQETPELMRLFLQSGWDAIKNNDVTK